MKEEVKRLGPFESRAKVLEEEVMKLITDLRVAEKKTVDVEKRKKAPKSLEKKPKIN